MLTDEQKAQNYRLSRIAEQTAKAVLKSGDRVGVTKCPGTKRVITFSHFAGHWIVSKSGIADYSPRSVYSVNGMPVDFTRQSGAPATGGHDDPLDVCTWTEGDDPCDFCPRCTSALHMCGLLRARLAQGSPRAQVGGSRTEEPSDMGPPF
ncbi:hypothetical protein E4T66_18575 [Sinimarinibacterium sp. CAU 1509]|uniref:hypothetical protein n=1 Tax=Sinimarinibacterium sp. CAU 1509 TaxID=2562283 RepID=UPI0010ACA056|nr:hypothetical protein [Sinimarinibacterium sp. CAU 1509]TJY57413.1 hypothetical protein E4T66_18575 [Sinimarinibacterium sp. CAU 1509]